MHAAHVDLGLLGVSGRRPRGKLFGPLFGRSRTFENAGDDDVVAGLEAVVTIRALDREVFGLVVFAGKLRGVVTPRDVTAAEDFVVELVRINQPALFVEDAACNIHYDGDRDMA